MDLQELVLKIKGDSTSAEAAMGRVSTSTNKLGGIIKAVIAGAAVAATIKWIETTVQLGVEAERAQALLASTMKTTLSATNEQIAAAQKWAETQEKVNHFDAELLMGQMDKAIVKYGDIKTAQLAVSASQEVARLKGIDVAAAYELVQGASNGMARSLKQFGVEAVTGTSQLSYLQQILEKTKGSTEAYNKTTAGMTEAMKLSYEVMRETLGQALLPIANTLMQTLSPIIEKITTYLTAHMPEINAFVVALQKGIAWVVETAGKMYEAIKPFITAIVETMGPYIKELFAWLGEHGINLQSVLVGVAKAIGTAFTILAAIIKGIIDSIGWVITKAQEAITWLQRVASNQGVNQGGVYAPASGGVWTPPAIQKGGKAYASGGWVGLNGPEIALVGEKGPERITPAGQATGNDRAILSRLDDLIVAVTRVAPGVSSAINGMGGSR